MSLELAVNRPSACGAMTCAIPERNPQRVADNLATARATARCRAAQADGGWLDDKSPRAQ